MSTHLLILSTLLCVIAHGMSAYIDMHDQAGDNSVTSRSPSMANLHRYVFHTYGPDQWMVQNERILTENGYTLTPGLGAHKLHARRLTWNAARRFCIQEGGHLAIINSLDEERKLLRMLEDNNISNAWLGVHDLFEEGDWVTLFDEAIEAAGYSKWTTKFANQPDNLMGLQHCGALLKEGGMDDEGCAAKNSFFCEIHI